MSTGIEVIPAVDLRGGKCVRLEQGRFDRETVFDADPLAAARRLTGGARRLHVVDLDGARSGDGANRRVIREMFTALNVAVQCGGGVRGESDVRSLLDAGASQVVIGSVAAEQPDTVRRWFRRFGAERLILALDVRAGADGVYRLASRGWEITTDATLDSALALYSAAGLRCYLCTDIGRDGMLRGPNVKLYRDLAASYPGLSLQASGGVRTDSDLEALSSAGVRQVIVGRALLEGQLTQGGTSCPQSA